MSGAWLRKEQVDLAVDKILEAASLAFVDLGVGQDGLMHSSRIPRGTTLAAGQVLDVEIERIEAERGRIGLRLPSSA